MKHRILVSASLFHALTDAATTVVPMVFPLLYSRSTLITSYSEIGLLSNLGLLATLLVQFLVVRLSCHVEYKTLMMASFVGISASLACVTLSTSFFTLLVFFLFLRVVTG
ncbi:MAG TPA: hypothetical protein VEG35_06990, partial [Burkholderiales bacterium]|nr:hypothetical protein [Burkholderiales bacterium]